MKFINEEDLTEENFKKAWEEIDVIREEYKQAKQHLNESSIPQFSSIEEARRHFGSIPFAEWEKNMLAKYGLKIDELTKKYV